MKISVIGSGYVGLITGVGLASKGNDVVCVDLIKEKVDSINSGKPPIQEKGLEKLLQIVLQNKRFRATTNLKEAILSTEVSFVCVGTPPKKSGAIDLSFIKNTSVELGKILTEKNSFHVVVIKSTVTPGTTENIVVPLLEKNSGKKAGIDFGVCTSPEFLREGKALEDFLNPDRIIIGKLDEESARILRSLHASTSCPIMETSPKIAEMIKYASNAFLAAKISFINEIGNICKILGIDTYEVAKGMGFDKRISPYFLNSGLGFGGSCLPKDVKALAVKSKKLGYELQLLKAVLSVNELQAKQMLSLAQKKLKTFKGKVVSVLGLAFKEGTDDVRESPSLKIISELLKNGAKVKAYDPDEKARENAKAVLGAKITYCAAVSDALKNSELCLICTPWPDFKNINFYNMKQKVVIDGRRILESREGIEYEGLCW